MPFGYAKTSKLTVTNQSDALRALADLSRRSIAHPLVKHTAKLLTRMCPPRADMCELESIFHAVRHYSWVSKEGVPGGDPDVPGLVYGVRYVADPIIFDSFTAPYRLLEEGIVANQAGGAPGGDCDDMAALIAALAGVVGFTTALRAYGPYGHDFEHVYAIVGFPKYNPIEWRALDTTVERAYVGWEPPPGNVLTAIVAGAGR